MNQRPYALAAEKLGGQQVERDLGACLGSIHRTLNHILLGGAQPFARHATHSGCPGPPR